MADGPWLELASWAINTTLSGAASHGFSAIFNVASAIWSIVMRCKENKFQLHSLVKTATDYISQLQSSSFPRSDPLWQAVLHALEQELERVLHFLARYNGQNVSRPCCGGRCQLETATSD